MLLQFLLYILLTGSAEAEKPASRPGGYMQADRFDYCESTTANSAYLLDVQDGLSRVPDALRRFALARQQLAREGATLAASIEDVAACREAFHEGRRIFMQHYAMAMQGTGRPSQLKLSENQKLRELQLEVVGQWRQDEAMRRALGTLPDTADDPATRWANALAQSRVRETAENSASVVEQARRTLARGSMPRPDGATLWRINDLAARYGLEDAAPR